MDYSHLREFELRYVPFWRITLQRLTRWPDERIEAWIQAEYRRALRSEDGYFETDAVEHILPEIMPSQLPAAAEGDLARRIRTVLPAVPHDPSGLARMVETDWLPLRARVNRLLEPRGGRLPD